MSVLLQSSYAFFLHHVHCYVVQDYIKQVNFCNARGKLASSSSHKILLNQDCAGVILFAAERATQVALEVNLVFSFMQIVLFHSSVVLSRVI
jgi:hypothetical protein